MGKSSGEPTCPTWMVTLGDCMSLLVTFFVLLLTFSTVKEDQLMELLGVINGALNTVDDMRMRDPENKQSLEGRRELSEETASRGRWDANYVDQHKVAPMSVREAVIQQRYNLMSSRLQSLGFGKNLTLVQLAEGLSLQVRLDSVFMPDGKNLKPEAYAILAAFADLALEVSNEVRISLLVGTGDGAGGQSDSQLLPQALTVGAVLSRRFKIVPTRMSYGLGRNPQDGQDRLELMLMDAIRAHDVAMRDVVRNNTDVW